MASTAGVSASPAMPAWSAWAPRLAHGGRGPPLPQAALLLFCLIDKPKGGKRAICLMASFMRSRAVCGRPAVEGWKAA
eukprot:11210246-Lingulodinium_polyedra.AAC.1